MFARDDSQVFECEYKGIIYCYRLLDSNIKTYDNGKSFNFIVNVWGKTKANCEFMVNFRLSSEDIDLAQLKTIEKIKEYVDKL